LRISAVPAKLIANGRHDRFGPMIQQAQHKQIEIRPAQAKGFKAGGGIGPGRGAGHETPEGLGLDAPSSYPQLLVGVPGGTHNI
jgi:hypothetical protein